VFRPTLTLRDIVTLTRNTFGCGQTQQLVSAITDRFATVMSPDQLAERLQLSWLMRREVAIQIRDIILLGYARREPMNLILIELLELVEQCDEHTE